MAAGIVYGAYHTSQLKSAAAAKEELAAYKKKEALIAEAKAKFAELNKKPEPVVSSSDIKEINFDDKDLDFGKVILSAVESLKN